MTHDMKLNKSKRLLITIEPHINSSRVHVAYFDCISIHRYYVFSAKHCILIGT